MSERIAKSRAWGLRLSCTDAVVLVAAAAGTVALWRMESPIWWLLAVVVGHFFLFCNVVRLHRSLELLWAIAFILNAGFWMWRQNLTLIPVLACQLPITVVLVIVELRSCRYHGIFAARLNPRLGEYLNRDSPS
jgi:hypothetical protein